MRSFRIQIAGETYIVEVDDISQSPIQVRVNDRPYQVEVEWMGAESEATVTPAIIPSQPVSPSQLPKTVLPEQPPPPRLKEGEVVGADIHEAPMPGTIVSVAVQVGEEIKVGDELCVLEAMKMRNSIKAARSGQIAEIMVRPGTKVAYGDPLVRFSDSQ